MYEYKVVKASKEAEIEEVMNVMAKRGWRVISTCFWDRWGSGILITFEREKTEE